MRVLFLMRNFSGYFRQFEPAFHELLHRGHGVHVGIDRRDAMDGRDWADALQQRFDGRFSWDLTPRQEKEGWYQLKRQLRLTRDYLHFLRPEFDSAPAFVARARKRAPDHAVRLFERRAMKSLPVIELASRLLYTAEDATPPSVVLDQYILDHDPHIVLLTPHLMPGSIQTEYLRTAQALGFRTGLCVASWDNLSSKQIIRVVPDVVTVWNDSQRREALEIHGLPEDSIAVTGAQVYDHWFDWHPRSRDEFCARVGIPPDRPFILYAAGALFPAKITEAEFGREWIRCLRECSHAELREASVLVRPHPKRVEEWSAVDLDGLEGVAFWPREGRMPVAADAKADFYDSIFHSAAVVGVNTSAMIESAIVGRRVHAMLVPEFSGSQKGTLHFKYLTDVGGGLLRTADDWSSHFAQLAEAVAEGPLGSNPNRRFLETFVRPHGLDKPAAPLFADAVEQAASHGPAGPRRPTVGQLLLRKALTPLASRLSSSEPGGRSLGRRARRAFEARSGRRRSIHSKEARVKPLGKEEREAYKAHHARRKAEKAARRAEKHRVVEETRRANGRDPSSGAGRSDGRQSPMRTGR